MKKIKPYHFLFLVLLSMLAAACGKKRFSDRVTLWRNDKDPYGCWYTYNHLSYIFPEADVVINKLSPDRYRDYSPKTAKVIEEAASQDNKKLVYMIIATSILPDTDETAALLNLVGSGKHVFLSGMHIAENLLDSLRLKTAYTNSFYNFYDSLTVSVKDPVNSDSQSFAFPGRALDNFIIEMDSSITTILGKDKYGRANFVKLDYEGGGSFYLHLAPIAFSNYFLLHKQNKGYYDNALSHLPKDLEVVRWDDYFRYHESGADRSGNRRSGFSALGWISNQRGLSTALWLVIALFALIYLVESKRKQRVIPIIPPVNNASLDFVKTIGRLYYQRRDNKNLGHKMTQHFLDHVRGKYNIRVSVGDPEFEKRLAWKSGQDPAAIHDLMYHMKYVQDQYEVSDEELMELNRRLENFYRGNT